MDNSLHYKGGIAEPGARKEARIFKQGIIKITKQFPAEEKYSLTNQFKRSSRNDTANLTEGYGRFHYQETIQFIRQARGSLTETYEHLHTAPDEGCINDDIVKKFEEQYKKVLKLINGYILFLRKSKTGK